MTSPYGKGVPYQYYFPMHPFVRRLSIPPLRYILLNHHVESNHTCCMASPHTKVCKRKIIFSCVRPCVRRPSICPPRYHLLNHWAELIQTCCMTAPHGKGTQEQNYFSIRSSVCPAPVHLFVTLSPPKAMGGI